MSNLYSVEHYVQHALELLRSHDIPGNWQVIFVPGMGQRLGTCNSSRRIIRISQAHFEGSPHEQILDTVRHEVAHAIVHHLHGSGVKPHGPEWKAVALRLGATPRASVPPTPQQKAARTAAREIIRASGRAPKRQRRPSFYAPSLGRVIQAGDLMTYGPHTYRVLETKRTRFTGTRLDNDRTYSIPAALLTKAALTPAPN